MSHATREKWSGRWGQLIGRAKRAWGRLTNDLDLQIRGEQQWALGWRRERFAEFLEELERRPAGSGAGAAQRKYNANRPPRKAA